MTHFNSITDPTERDITDRLPMAADMAAEATRLGARYYIQELNKLIREATGNRGRSCTCEAPVNASIVEALERKGFTVTHDGTAYQISW